MGRFLVDTIKVILILVKNDQFWCLNENYWAYLCVSMLRPKRESEFSPMRFYLVVAKCKRRKEESGSEKGSRLVMWTSRNLTKDHMGNFATLKRN